MALSNSSDSPPVSLPLPQDWRSVWADFILVGLVSGPIAAPFLAAAPLPVLPQIAQIIYAMGGYVCPQPDMGVELWPPHLMAVCMRCYGTLLGLVAMRYWVVKTNAEGWYWLHRRGWLGLLVTIALCLVYPFELYAQVWGWWSYNNGVVTLFGLISGLGLGAYIMPWLHRQPPAQTAQPSTQR